MAVCIAGSFSVTFPQRDIFSLGIKSLGVVSLGLRGISWKQVVRDIKAAVKNGGIGGGKVELYSFF
jgi:hypothetical protein